MLPSIQVFNSSLSPFFKPQTSRYSSPSLMASPLCPNKESPVSIAPPSPSPSSPLFSPSSDKRFWSTLRTRVDTILDSQTASGGCSNRSKRLKQDSLLLLRGFDSIASSLSQLTGNLENALQGARDLSKAPTFTEMLHSISNGAQSDSKVDELGKPEENNEDKKGVKRKLEADEDAEQTGGETNALEEENIPNQVNGKLNKAKNLAASMAAKAGWLSRELKSVKSDLCFVQDRCALLEEENRRLRDGFVKGIRPEEDDLVRLQLEALLAEKSRLANENTNLTRENQCLRQLVEYHQLAAQDFSAPYEQVMEGLCLVFSSPLRDEEGKETQPDFEFPICHEESLVVDEHKFES